MVGFLSRANLRATKLRNLQAHALAALDLMAVDSAMDDARHVLRWIERNGMREFSRRDAQQALRGRLKRVRGLSPALEILIEHGYVAPIRQPENSGPGRRPSPRYAVNPRCLPHYSQNSQRFAMLQF